MNRDQEIGKTTESGFPIGRVARTLREILNRKLTSQDVEIITVVLFGHLLVENRLNDVIFYLLSTDLPREVSSSKSKRKSVENTDKKMLDQVWEKVSGTRFIQKLDYIEPCLKRWYPKLVAQIKEMNTIRNRVMHGRNIEHIKYVGYPIWSEKGVEKYFLACQSVSKNLSDFLELVDSPHAQAEKWAKRLKKLGEPLL